MTTTLGILGALAVVSALGAIWDRFGKRRRRPLQRSDAERARDQGTVDYYANVWDSTAQ